MPEIDSGKEKKEKHIKIYLNINMNKRVVLLRDVFCKPFKKQITQLFLIGAIGLIPVSAFAQAYQVTMKRVMRLCRLLSQNWKRIAVIPFL